MKLPARKGNLESARRHLTQALELIQRHAYRRAAELKGMEKILGG